MEVPPTTVASKLPYLAVTAPSSVSRNPQMRRAFSRGQDRWHLCTQCLQRTLDSWKRHQGHPSLLLRLRFGRSSMCSSEVMNHTDSLWDRREEGKGNHLWSNDRNHPIRGWQFSLLFWPIFRMDLADIYNSMEENLPSVIENIQIGCGFYHLLRN